MSSIDLQALQKTGGAQLDLNPVVVSLHAGTAGLPAITGVHSRGRKNDVGRLSVTVIAALDHPAAVGHRGKVKHGLFLGENGRHITVNAKTGLCGYPMILMIRTCVEQRNEMIDKTLITQQNDCRSAYNSAVRVHVQLEMSVDVIRSLDSVKVMGVSAQWDLWQNFLPLLS